MPQDLISKSIQIVMLPISDLVVPDWNPRKFMDEAPLRDLTAYLEKGGPVPRILVWKGNGQTPFSVISGQRRLEAYKRLGRERVEVEILDITLAEAQIMANTSNDGEELFWLDRYEGWERLKAEQVWDQATLAVKLGKSSTLTNRAIRILRVLNANSRQIIRETLPGSGTEGGQKGPKITPPISGGNWVHDFKPISEGNDLNTEDNTRPGLFTSRQVLPLTIFLATNPKEDAGDLKAQALAEKALPIMIARGLTESQARNLVAWMFSGGNPSQFEPKAKQKKGAKQPTAPRESRSEANPSPATASQQAPSSAAGQAGEEALSKTHSTSSGQAGPVQNQGSVVTTLGQWVVKGFKWVLRNPIEAFKLFILWLKKQATYEFEKIHRRVQTQVVNWIVGWVVIFLCFLAAYTVIFNPRFWTKWMISHSQEPPAVELRTTQGTNTQVEPSGHPIVEPSGQGPASATGQSQAITVQSNPAQIVQQTSKPTKQARKPKPRRNTEATGIVIPEGYKALIDTDSHFVLGFTGAFYGFNYRAIQEWMDYFKGRVSNDYYHHFMNQFFPDEKIVDMRHHEIYMSFEPTQPVKLLRLDDQSGEFLVEGLVTTRSNLNSNGEVLSKKPIALSIGLLHGLGIKGPVYSVKEVGTDNADSPTLKKGGQGGFSSSTEGDGVTKAVGDVVGEAAKKAFGF